MEPRIQYAKTSDGVRIACFTLGEGAPLVSVAMATSPAWTTIISGVPRGRTFIERIAQRYKHVLYDGRGTGLSDREASAQSLDVWVADLDAVADALDLSAFALFGLGFAPTAIAYAARRPERVSHLILWNPVDFRAVYGPGTALGDAFTTLFQTDWLLFTETTQHAWAGWSDSETARLGAAALRDSMTHDMYARQSAALNAVHLAPLLPAIKAPTLVMSRRQVQPIPVDSARDLASLIPKAELVLVEGDSPLPWVGDMEPVLTSVDEFLSGGHDAASRPSLPSGTAIILFADIADSTALTERLGDSAFRDKARELETALRAAITDAGGTAIDGKLLGDGVLALFTSARQAIEAARRCAQAGESCGLPLHLGLHAGDVIREEGNVYGGAVNIASRIADASAPGEVLVSQTVRDLARTSAGVSFEDRGERELKGVGEPVRVWAVRERDEA